MAPQDRPAQIDPRAWHPAERARRIEAARQRLRAREVAPVDLRIACRELLALSGDPLDRLLAAALLAGDGAQARGG